MGTELAAPPLKVLSPMRVGPLGRKNQKGQRGERERKDLSFYSKWVEGRNQPHLNLHP